MIKEQEVFEKVNRIRIDFFDSKYKDVHTDDELEEKYEALGDVLSMLKEKDKEIDKQDRELKHRLCKEVNQMFAEVEKQDKIIDLMAEYIANRDNDEDICRHQVAEWCEDEEDGVLVEVCRKCIKQYFERKVENVKNKR